MDNTECRILSIDAWREDQSWTWNNWFDTGETIDIDCLSWSNRKILKYLRDNARILSDYSKGKVFVENDQYNLIICDKNNCRPLYAIEYGNLI